MFQVYFYGHHLKINENAREQYRGSPHFDRTAEFCALYDEVSFDAGYASEPMATFEPMVRRSFARTGHRRGNRRGSRRTPCIVHTRQPC